MQKANQTNNWHYNKKLQPFANKLRKAMTKAEACLWKYALKAGKMKSYPFRRQRPVLNYIADFMCIPLMLIIELDGITHDHQETVKNDQKKENELKAIGFEVLRFTDRDVLNDMDSVIRTIEGWIEEREVTGRTSVFKSPPP